MISTLISKIEHVDTANDMVLTNNFTPTILMPNSLR